MEVITALRKYNTFLDTEYELVLGRKGKSKALTITFDKTCWFHVRGIHYLDDTDINQNRRSIETFYDNKSVCIYAFSKARTKFYTTIDGNYLILDLRSTDSPVNLFLVFEKIDDNTVKPMSVFYSSIDQRTGKSLDFADGQMKYTVLKSIKKNKSSGIYEEIYRNPNYKEDK